MVNPNHGCSYRTYLVIAGLRGYSSDNLSLQSSLSCSMCVCTTRLQEVQLKDIQISAKTDTFLLKEGTLAHLELPYPTVLSV